MTKNLRVHEGLSKGMGKRKLKNENFINNFINFQILTFMRKLKLLLVTLALIVGGIGSAWAQSWTGNAPAAGEFYLYNVGQQKFLTSGNWWGTHAALDTDGMAVTLAGDGSYTISTAVAFAGKYLGDNEYVDNGTAASWTFEKVGETDKYTMKTGTKYFVSNANGVPVNSETAPTTDAGYWQLVTRQQLIDNLNNATPASPIDASFYMTNPKVRRGWPKSIEGTDLNDNGSFNAGNEGLYAGGCTSYGQWHKTFDNYQALTGVKNGKYKVRVKGVIRIDDGENVHIPYLYANDQKGADFKTIVESDYSSLAGGNAAEKVTHLLVDDTYLLDWLEVTVTDGNLRVGVKSDANVGWATFAQFTIMFVDPCISSSAIELPANGAMAADTWYKYTVAVTGNYSISATTEANIIQTTSGDQLNSVATGSALVTGANVALTAGDVIYYKSNSANTLTIEANIKTYTVGDVTATSIADNTYLQSLTTATFTLGDAASNDGTATLALQGTPVASLKKGDSEVKTGALTLNAETHVVTAAFESVTLDPDATYTITLPANAVAWDMNTTNKNSEKVITFKTPAVFDGTYFIATTEGTQFISRGGNSNTEAILDEFGIAATFTTDANNVTTITFVDNNKHLAGGSQSVYNDKTRDELEAEGISKSEGPGKGERANWRITANADGYNIYSNKWSKYIGKGSGAEAPNYATVATYTDATPYKWMLVTPADHTTTVAAYKDANAAAVATAANAAGITAVAGKTTVTDLKAVIEGTGWVSKNIAVTDAITSVQEKYQYADTETPISENLTSLENGIYKVKLSVFKRIAGNDATYELYNNDQDSPTAYLFAGSNKAQVPSVMSESSTDAYTEGWNPNYAIAGNNYPNSMGAAGQAFDAGRYTLEVFAYVSDGTLSIGLKNPAKYGNGNWLCYRDLEVTQYKEFTGNYTALAAAITTAEANTLGFENGEYAPYNNVAALTALAAAKTLNTNQNALTQTEIDNATTALTGAIWTANASDVECVYNGNFANELTGWTRTNPWGQKREDVYGSTTGYYNQPGSLQYGNAGVYTMPLKTGTIYSLTFKYASWEDNSNGGMTVSVLNGENGMAAKTFEAYKTKYTNGLGEQTILFVTGAAGDYVLTLANSGNTVITGVSITKAANQYLEFADGAPLPKYAPGTYPTVKITRSLTANRWVTAVYPFVISDADVNEIVDLSSYNAVTGELGFTSVSASTVNRPFLMRSTTDKTEITLTGVGVEDIINTPKRICDEASLIGVYATTTVDNTAKNYVLSNNTIYYIGENSATVNPYRAYIQIAQASEAPALTFTIDDETTAIEGINANENNDDDAYYNLQGQRVTNPQNGVYIHKGRKVWVK